MGRKLTTNVHVNGEWYPTGAEPPTEVAELITNPDVWDTPAPEASTEEKSVEVKEPNRGGPGSGVDAWRAFAGAQGLEVPEGASARDIAALWDAKKSEG